MRNRSPIIAMLACALLAVTVMLAAVSARAKQASAEPHAKAPELSGEEARRAQSIARNTMSPFCPGRTLADCPSPNAGDWREDIREWVHQGLTSQQIRARLEDRLPEGRELSGAPSTGLGWALPVFLALGALVVLAIVLRRLRERDNAPAPQNRTARSDAVNDEGAGPDSTDDEALDGESRHSRPRVASSASGDKDAELERRLDAELERDEG